MTRLPEDMIRVPGDKSISHRALLLSALASGRSRLAGLLPGEDCRSTAAALRAMGCAIPALPDDGGWIQVDGVGRTGLVAPRGPLDCGNSGTTARLLLGLLSGLSLPATLTGDASLRSRPMARVTDPLSRAGGRFEWEEEPDRLPVTVHPGALTEIEHRSKVASAQVKSSLLLAGLGAGVPVSVEEPVSSRDHSERMLRRMGIPIQSRGVAPHHVHLDGGEFQLHPLELRVPGDISSAAFFLVLGALGQRALTLENVGLNPTRTGALAVLRRMGAQVEIHNAREMDDPGGEPAGDLLVAPGRLEGVEIGGDEIPSLIDEIPILAVAASRARGTTVIRDAQELRVKESDRIHALARNFQSIGVSTEERPDGLVIQGGSGPLEGQVSSFGDHRIAMAFAILGALPGNRIQVDDRRIVEVSFPGFWERLSALAEAGTHFSSGRLAGAGTSGGNGEGRRVNGEEDADRGRPPVVTLDGPAGSGKSTTAGEVARRLGFLHLDSGALYRAVTLVLLDSELPRQDWAEHGAEVLEKVSLGLEAGSQGLEVQVEGRTVSHELRSPDVTAQVASVAALPWVRERLLAPLREAARDGGVVADGRDMGTVVLPDAEVKVYLTASLEERARRRLLQEGREEVEPEIESTAQELARRDRADRERKVAPLRRPADALVLDTTGLGFQEQVNAILKLVHQRWKGGG